MGYTGRRIPMTTPDFVPRHSVILRQYMRYAMYCTHSPEVYLFGAFLPPVAHLLAAEGFTIDGKPPRLMLGLIGGSGTGKTTAMKLARDVHTRVYAHVLPERRNPYLDLAGTVPGVLDEVRRYFIPERGLTCAIFTNDELTQVMGDAQLADTINKLYDGGDFKRHLRVNQRAQKDGSLEKDAHIIRQPVISGVMASTPVSMREFVTTAHISGGMFPRILFVRQSVTAEQLREAQRYDDPARNQIVANMSTWYKRWLHPLAVTGHREVVYDDGAQRMLTKQLWTPFRKTIADEDSRMSGILARAKAHGQVIAACIAALSGSMADVPGTGRKALCVTEEHAFYASLYVKVCLDATARLVEETFAVGKLVSLQNRLLQALADAKGQGMSKRDVYRNYRLNKAEADLIIDGLLDRMDIAVGRKHGVIRHVWHAHHAPRELTPRLARSMVLYNPLREQLGAEGFGEESQGLRLIRTADPNETV